MTTISIDVGIKNYAILIVSEKGKILTIENIDLRPYTCSRLVKVLDDFIGTQKVKKVLVERQIKTSLNVSEVAHHTEAYFSIKFPDCEYKIIDPRKKDLDGTKGYSARKKVSVEKALEFLKKENLTEFYEKISAMKKKDDVCDAICQWLSVVKI